MNLKSECFQIFLDDDWAWRCGPFIDTGFKTPQEALQAGIDDMKTVSDAEFKAAVNACQTFDNFSHRLSVDSNQPSADFWHRLGNCTEVIEMASTPARLYILVAHLQLALRHPKATGGSSKVVREIAENMIKAICHHFPEAEEHFRLGWDPAYDIEQDYFNLEF
ncbi:MAG: hypothetical protein AAGL08_13825 [Cyanobacteria bacterium J06573_11]